MSGEMRTGDTVRHSDIGSMEALEIVRSHVSARAIEAVCRLTANSLDLETLMTSSSIPLGRRAKPFPSRSVREGVSNLALRMKSTGTELPSRSRTDTLTFPRRAGSGSGDDHGDVL